MEGELSFFLTDLKSILGSEEKKRRCKIADEPLELTLFCVTLVPVSHFMKKEAAGLRRGVQARLGAWSKTYICSYLQY